jgi:hypothetical protein
MSLPRSHRTAEGRVHGRLKQADRARSLVVCLDSTSRFMNVFVLS